MLWACFLAVSSSGDKVAVGLALAVAVPVALLLALGVVVVVLVCVCWRRRLYHQHCLIRSALDCHCTRLGLNRPSGLRPVQPVGGVYMVVSSLCFPRD